MTSKRHNFFWTFIFCFLPLFNGFYVPGVAPKEFKDGDGIEVKAIKLTSVKTVVSYEYYTLPFCRPAGDLHYKSENLGEVLRGDRIVNTAYEVFMKKDETCRSLCSSTKQPVKSLNTEESAQLRRRISEDYHVHLLIDNLPCATKYTVPETNEVFYDHDTNLDGLKMISFMLTIIWIFY
jgi:transmembrane 9 superfamily protein 2/4